MYTAKLHRCCLRCRDLAQFREVADLHRAVRELGNDLQLAAPRLLAAPRHNATLTPADSTGAARTIFDLGGPAARYLFWGALVLVAGFLVWLVARLLPRPPAS